LRCRATISRALVSPGTIGTDAGDARRAGVLRRLAQQDPGRTDTVLVTHTGNIGAAFEQSVEEGELLVLRPSPGAAGPRLVGTVKPDDWRRLRAAWRSRAK
jgi:mRNA-degrading endonuclease toxin of MazEF toxin-antitoxin module